jgi:hypothetical protein
MRKILKICILSRSEESSNGPGHLPDLEPRLHTPLLRDPTFFVTLRWEQQGIVWHRPTEGKKEGGEGEEETDRLPALAAVAAAVQSARFNLTLM